MISKSKGMIIVSKNCEGPTGKAAKILQDRIKERTGKIFEIRKEDEDGAFSPLKIIIGSLQNPYPLLTELQERAEINKESLGKEGVAIKTLKEGESLYLLIVGASPAATIFAIGKLLRSVKYQPDSLLIPELNILEGPAHEVRGTFIATHEASRSYLDWDINNWEEYIEDLALWGINSIFYFPTQFGQWSEAVRLGNGNEEERKKWELLSSKVPELIKSYGLNIGVHINFNDVFPENVSKFKPAETGTSEYIEVAGLEGGEICPSYPEAQKAILDVREELFRRLPYIDFLSIDIVDAGGCGCKRCKTSYIDTYFKVCKGIAGRLREYHPEAKVIINTQALSEKGIELFCQHLRKDSLWLGYILYDCYGLTLTLKELKSRIPDRLRDKILAQPEITMRDGWGKRGATPWVRHFDHAYEKSYDLVALGGWSMEKNKYWHPEGSYLILPDNLPRACAVEELNGACSYSEGLHDDIPKLIWAQEGWNPEQDPVDILDEYCSWYFGEKAKDKMVKAILKMEEVSILRPKFKTKEMLESASKISELIESAEREIPTKAKEGWRWKMLLLRAKMEMLIASGGEDAKLKEEIVHLHHVVYRLTKTKYGQKPGIGKEALERILARDHKIYDLRIPLFEI